jgi:hypothetical protein
MTRYCFSAHVTRALCWCVLFACGCLTAEAADRLIVHEWGTFTTLQNEHGQELTGINVDDEPVPPFVHNLSPYVLSRTLLTSPYWSYRQKGAPRQHPHVTMRLETPVIYFYPPAAARLPMNLTVAVEFRGGWLTEFYPNAEVEAPGLHNEKGNVRFEELTSQTVGKLKWRDVRVGTREKGPETDWAVWNAPRNVAAADVTASSGESERYLFYRGVGRQRAPLRVTLDRSEHTGQIRGNFGEVLHRGESVEIPNLWLTHVRADGRVAFRSVPPVRVHQDESAVLAMVNTNFRADQYSVDNLEQLMTEMHAALVKQGLYADEATALLTTWRRAYFASHGLRLFFLVPRAWTDHYLPLTISQEADVERVMMGRVELISDEQRALLDELAQTPVSNRDWVNELPDSPEKQKFLAGRTGFGDLGIPLPPDYQIYYDLGRFRNALIAAEERKRPDGNLSQFITTYGLQPYRW